jgi:hypothetical protein
MTFGKAATLHMQCIEERVTIKRRQKKYWRETLEALERSWPELPEKEIRRITPEACREWATRYAKVASDNCYNNTVSLLRHVLAVAIESAAFYSNPAAKLERVTVRGKVVELPTLAGSASSSPKYGAPIAAIQRIARTLPKVSPTLECASANLTRFPGRT